MDGFNYNLLKKGIEASALRQETISSNISNVNTPNYKVNKVVFEDYLSRAIEGSGMKQTHEGHMHTGGRNTFGPILEKDTSTSVKDNGNNVNIDYEMAELAANSIQHDAIVSQLNAKYSMMRSVMK